MNSKYKVHSFDVFDTCISRTYEKPTDLFFHLGSLIAPTFAKKEAVDDFSNLFMHARVLAEKKAYKMHGRKKSCKMYEIYSLLELPPYCAYSKKKIMDLEKKLEYEASYSIEKTKSIISNLRKEKKRIVFVSDMYLDKDFIKMLLIKNGFFKIGDNIYVSSDTYLTKRSGDLYKLLLKNENIKAQELLHYGDNKYSDIHVAKKMGIDTVYIDFTNIRTNEIVFPSQKFNPQIRRLNSIPKFIRLTKAENLEGNQQNFFSMVAPILVAFTAWAIIEASKKNIKRLYFSARDGELPFKIAKLLCRNEGIQIKFLYGSRKAWLLPSTNIEDEQWKFIAAPKKEKSSIKDCLERLGFNELEIHNLSGKLTFSNSELSHKFSSEMCLKKIDELLKKKTFIEIFEKKIEAARNDCTAYLIQEGFFEKISWAIVDSGWTLKTQASLRKIIEAHDKSTPTKGLYFGLSPDCLSDMHAGEALSFINERKFFYQKAIAIEHCFFPSDLETTIGYRINEDRVVPIFNISKEKNGEYIFSKKLHEYVIAYTQAINDLNINYNIFYEHSSYLKANLINILSHPKKEIAKIFSELYVDFDIRQTNENRIKLIKYLNLNDIIKIILGVLNIRQRDPHFWPEASAELSSSIPKILLKTLLFIKNLFNIDKKKYNPNNVNIKK